jgi:hypothetical protein
VFSLTCLVLFGIGGICVFNLYTLLVSDEMTGGLRTAVTDQSSITNLEMQSKMADLVQTIQNQEHTIAQLAAANSQEAGQGQSDHEMQVSDLIQTIKNQESDIARLTIQNEESAIAQLAPLEMQVLDLTQTIKKQESAIAQLKPLELQVLDLNQTVKNQQESAIAQVEPPRPLTSAQSDCNRAYGPDLVNAWVRDPVKVCHGGSSSITCYTHQHEYDTVKGKIEAEKKQAWYCVAENVEVDFSKPNFGKRSIFADCNKNPEWDALLQTFFVKNNQHMRHLLGAFVFDVGERSQGNIKGSTTPTYLLWREIPHDNLFHHSSDLINMHTVYQAQGLVNGETQVVLVDTSSDGPFYPLIQEVFSKGMPLKRVTAYNKETVKFDKLIFHLDGKAAPIFPGRVAEGKALTCLDTFLFHGYRHRVLDALNLWDVPPPRAPVVTLVTRRRTKTANTGRILANEKALESIMNECTMCNVQAVDLAKLPIIEQIALVRHTNVLVGVHGAGLMHIMFAAEEAVLLEIHPHYRLHRHFRNACRMTGKIYMPLR